MRYFKDTVPVICNCQISCFSLSIITFLEKPRKVSDKSPFVDVRVVVVQSRVIKGKQ